MPQEFQILRCCDCEKFQVHHVKKAKKWQCKVCGLKQSMKRAFFIGSSRDCRVNVQKLNFQAGEQEMRRKLGESCSSVEDDISSDEVDTEDFEFSPTNAVDANHEIDESDWVDNNDGMDENDWFEENDWMVENDWIVEKDEVDQIPPENLHSLCSRNPQSDLKDELPRKKLRCESYSESEAVGKDNMIHSNEDLKDQGDFIFLSTLKSQPGEQSSKPAASANNTSRTDILKIESRQECYLFKDKEKNTLPGVTKSKTNSVLKPTSGFQLILSEAKKQRADLNYDLDL